MLTDRLDTPFSSCVNFSFSDLTLVWVSICYLAYDLWAFVL